MNEESPSRHRFVTLAPLSDPRVKRIGHDPAISPREPTATTSGNAISVDRSHHPQGGDNTKIDSAANRLTSEGRGDTIGTKHDFNGSEKSGRTDRPASIESLGEGNVSRNTEIHRKVPHDANLHHPRAQPQSPSESHDEKIVEEAGYHNMGTLDSGLGCRGCGESPPTLQPKALQTQLASVEGDRLASAMAGDAYRHENYSRLRGSSMQAEQAATQESTQELHPTPKLTSDQFGLDEGAGDCLSSSTSSASPSPRSCKLDGDVISPALQGTAASRVSPVGASPGVCDADKLVQQVASNNGQHCSVADDARIMHQQLNCVGSPCAQVDGVGAKQGRDDGRANRGARVGCDLHVGTLEGAVFEPWHQWSELELPQLQPLTGQVLRIFCGVWNLHGKSAPADLSAWLVTQPQHHVYVVGTCECERSIEKSMIWADKSRWEAQVCNHLGKEYRMIRSHNMSAIHVMVLVHRYLWRYIWDIKSAQVATGFGNLIGNKGGTQIGFNVGRTSILCVNAHLAAHASKMKERTQNLARILVDSPIRREKASSGVHEDYDRVFFMGDLNPRLNAKRTDVDAWLAGKQLDKCLEKDQLLPLLHSELGDQVDSLAGMWPWFEEAAIQFPPTYKFDTHTDRYDSSKKQRVPSWTDRILWKRDSQVRSLAYGSIESLQCSDHRPIFAQFEVMVDLDHWEGPEVDSTKDKKSTVCCVQ
mmetsp:Transcript_142608/g.371552  ORF Transcript_142608/g.371552 Transcript_142608/m.371552 type:complete len:703 (+) Transcript_142608:110-2218(+)